MSKSTSANFGIVITALALAQFIMTVDTTIMNVSIPTLVSDLNTTVGSVQSAITLYALVMASFMLIGGKLGEIYGRKKIFKLGLIIYGTGSLITALSPNIYVLIFGWSILEGLGASMMMPAMLALITINFSGKQRISALGITAGVAGAAAALGPIIGGALSTYASWRYAFIAEVVIAIATFIMARNIPDKAKKLNEKIDTKGAVLAASGLGIFVCGILQASTYGWIRATKPMEIAGFSIAPFGLSPVLIICGIGVLLLWRLLVHSRQNESESKPSLLKASLLKIITLKSSLSIVLITQLVLGGTLFIMPLFLQLVLGFSAMKSGVALLPLSVTLIVGSILSTKLAHKFSAISTIRSAQVVLIVGLGVLASFISNEASLGSLLVPFVLIGAGLGVIFPLVQSIILGSVQSSDSSQAAGLNYTYQQLGMSLGTAVIGSVLLFALGSGLVKGLSSSEYFDSSTVSQNSVAISSNVEFVSNDQLVSALDKTDELSSDQKDEIVTLNSDARLRAIKISLVVAMIFAIMALQSSGKVKDALSQ